MKRGWKPGLKKSNGVVVSEQVLKHNYWAKFQSGHLSSRGLLVMEKTLHLFKMKVDKPLEQWSLLQKVRGWHLEGEEGRVGAVLCV